jgi:hypothetical protein
MASAEGTGFAVKLPTNGPDLPDLFVHRSLLQEMVPVCALLSMMILILGQGRIFENTVEVGGAELKGGRMLGKKSSPDAFI